MFSCQMADASGPISIEQRGSQQKVMCVEIKMPEYHKLSRVLRELLKINWCYAVFIEFIRISLAELHITA
jgi:hypothetical protein